MKDLQKLASDFFKKNPKTEKLYVSTDGYLFVSKNAAELHKKTSSGKVGIKEFDNEFTEDMGRDKTMTAKEKIQCITNAKTVEEVNTLIEDEKRKSVLAAAEKKLKELTASSDSTNNDETGKEDEDKDPENTQKETEKDLEK